MCVNNLSKVALDSAAAGIEPATSSRMSNALTTAPPSHTVIVLIIPNLNSILTKRPTAAVVSCVVRVFEAESEPQRVATALLHLVPASRRILRAQHVRRSRRRKLPQVSRESGAGGKSSTRRRAREKGRPQAKTFVGFTFVVHFYMHRVTQVSFCIRCFLSPSCRESALWHCNVVVYLRGTAPVELYCLRRTLADDFQKFSQLFVSQVI